MKHPVLAAVDGSAESLRAVDWAADDAALRGLPHDYPRDDACLAEQVLDLSLNNAAEAFPDVPVERYSVEGSARRALLRAADNADLVVLGARRRQGHLGLQLGPTNHAVLRHAHCPVAIVPAA